MSAAVRRPVPMTVSEFMEASRHLPGRCHLIDGELVAMAPASRRHGVIQGQAAIVLGTHLRDSSSACRVLGVPGVTPRAFAAINMRVPDLAVVCPDAGGGKPFEGPPTVLIEILSPSNASVTWANVWAFTTIPEVMEILVLTSGEVTADLLRRRRDGTWPEDPERIGADGAVELPSIGYRGALAAFYPPEIR